MPKKTKIERTSLCHFKLFRIAKLHITTPPFDLAVERFHLALELGIGTWRRGDLIHSGQEFSLLLKSFRLVFSTTQSHVYHSLDPVCGLKWAETRDIGRFAMWKQQVNLLLEKDYTLVLMTWRFFLWYEKTSQQKTILKTMITYLSLGLELVFHKQASAINGCLVSVDDLKRLVY